MKRSIRFLAGWVIMMLSLGLVFGPIDSGAQQKASTLKQEIQGTWLLVSAVNEQDGKKIDVFGPNPRGSLILTPEGRYAMILMRASLPKFASNNRLKGTPEENQAVVQGSAAGFGRYTVDNDKEQMVILHMEGSTFPNWDGQDQKRIVTVTGEEMKFVIPSAAIGGTNYLIWKRAK
jgi:Lipocalin-like domain